MEYEYWWAECSVCEQGISEFDEEYKYAVHPILATEYYVHGECVQMFHERYEMGFCDLCDGTTWFAGYHEDARFDTDPETGNHVECEREYVEAHKRKDYCYNPQCEWHEAEG